VQVPGILPIQAEEWYTCYLIEESLSMDNLFAFYMVFLYFKVSHMTQMSTPLTEYPTTSCLQLPHNNAHPSVNPTPLVNVRPLYMPRTVRVDVQY
jgi:hypothetical protein